MSVPALVDDVRPEVDVQLALGGSDFDIVRALADAGAITTTALILTDPEMPYEQFAAVGRWVGVFNRACSWWIGDWLVFGEGTYPDRLAQAASETGLAEQTLLNRVYVAKHVPPSRRRPTLSFSAHAEVAPLGAREQKRWLDRAEAHGWSRAELRAQMKAARVDAKPMDLDEDEVQTATLIEAARSLVRNAEIAGENVICRIEDYTRVRAALGEED